MGQPTEFARIEDAVRDCVARHERVVLAVSGGADSMALLSAAAVVAPESQRILVASFDHGTGEAASRAVELVRRVAAEGGLRFVTDRAGHLPRREAAWRDARWTFLRRVAHEERARVVTAHTEDDHLETVVMRILRQSGARGLAALLAPSAVERPLLAFPRHAVREYARRRQLEYVEDPSNRDLAFFRNRIRSDLLPALLARRPELRNELLALSRRAARLRGELDAVASVLVVDESTQGAPTAPAALADYPGTSLAALWPAILARAGAVADRRTIARLESATSTLRVGSSIPISGGFEVVRRRHQFVVGRRAEPSGRVQTLASASLTQLGGWRIYPIEVTTISGSEFTSDPWHAELAAGPAYEVRAWRPGDRMRAHEGGTTRRVARFFEDAGVCGAERRGWPVVVDGADVVWIPGIRRGAAATARSGRPSVVYRCERERSRSET